MVGAVRRRGQGGPHLQRELSPERGAAVGAVRRQRWLRAPAAGADGEDGDCGQPPPQHQLLLRRGSPERRVRAAAQEEVLHPGQRVHESAR